MQEGRDSALIERSETLCNGMRDGDLGIVHRRIRDKRCRGEKNADGKLDRFRTVLSACRFFYVGRRCRFASAVCLIVPFVGIRLLDRFQTVLYRRWRQIDRSRLHFGGPIGLNRCQVCNLRQRRQLRLRSRLKRCQFHQPPTSVGKRNHHRRFVCAARQGFRRGLFFPRQKRLFATARVSTIDRVSTLANDLSTTDRALLHKSSLSRIVLLNLDLFTEPICVKLTAHS